MNFEQTVNDLVIKVKQLCKQNKVTEMIELEHLIKTVLQQTTRLICLDLIYKTNDGLVTMYFTNLVNARRIVMRIDECYLFDGRPVQKGLPDHLFTI